MLFSLIATFRHQSKQAPWIGFCARGLGTGRTEESGGEWSPRCWLASPSARIPYYNLQIHDVRSRGPRFCIAPGNAGVQVIGSTSMLVSGRDKATTRKFHMMRSAGAVVPSILNGSILQMKTTVEPMASNDLKPSRSLSVLSFHVMQSYFCTRKEIRAFDPGTMPSAQRYAAVQVPRIPSLPLVIDFAFRSIHIGSPFVLMACDSWFSL